MIRSSPFLLCMVFILMYSSQFCQDKIQLRGKITDATSGEELIGVHVRIYDTSGNMLKGVVTNSQGNYVVGILSNQTYRFKASFIGYASRNTIALQARQWV